MYDARPNRRIGNLTDTSLFKKKGLQLLCYLSLDLDENVEINARRIGVYPVTGCTLHRPNTKMIVARK